MNAPLNSDSGLYPRAETPSVSGASSYSPSVPISVYRELATELKTTKATVEALTKQNQQIKRQNQLLRTEIQRFVQAAEQLGHFAGVAPERSAAEESGGSLPQAARTPDAKPVKAALEQVIFTPETLSPKADPEIVPHGKQPPRDRPQPPQPAKQRLFTEQPEGIRPLSAIQSGQSLGYLWLATTILIVVMTAFGAGFLIMRPLLNR